MTDKKSGYQPEDGKRPVPPTSGSGVMGFVSASCQGEKCRCGEPAEHKIEEAILHDDPMPFRHPLTSYVCHQHFVWLMGPAAGEHAKRRPTAIERIEHIARDVAHELHNRDCFAFTGGGESRLHSAECEAAYQRIKTTLTAYARGVNEP